MKRMHIIASSFVILTACGGSGGPDVEHASELAQGTWSCPASSPFGSSLVLTAAGKNLEAQWLPELIMVPDVYFENWPPEDPGDGDDEPGPGGGQWAGVVTMTLERSSLTPAAQASCTVERVTNDRVSLEIIPQDPDLEVNTVLDVRLGASEAEYCPIDWQGLCDRP
jgi:hypothetical protein